MLGAPVPQPATASPGGTTRSTGLKRNRSPSSKSRSRSPRRRAQDTSANSITSRSDHSPSSKRARRSPLSRSSPTSRSLVQTDPHSQLALSNPNVSPRRHSAHQSFVPSQGQALQQQRISPSRAVRVGLEVSGASDIRSYTAGSGTQRAELGGTLQSQPSLDPTPAPARKKSRSPQLGSKKDRGGQPHIPRGDPSMAQPTPSQRDRFPPLLPRAYTPSQIQERPSHPHVSPETRLFTYSRNTPPAWGSYAQPFIPQPGLPPSFRQSQTSSTIPSSSISHDVLAPESSSGRDYPSRPVAVDRGPTRPDTDLSATDRRSTASYRDSQQNLLPPYSSLGEPMTSVLAAAPPRGGSQNTDTPLSSAYAQGPRSRARETLTGGFRRTFIAPTPSSISSDSPFRTGPQIFLNPPASKVSESPAEYHSHAPHRSRPYGFHIPQASGYSIGPASRNPGGPPRRGLAACVLFSVWTIYGTCKLQSRGLS